jgi:chloramphenicol 3-O-phosphotransferase
LEDGPTSFFRFVDKRAIYQLGMISLAHALLHVTNSSVINVHVDEFLAHLVKGKVSFLPSFAIHHLLAF